MSEPPVRIVTKNFGVKDSHRLGVYESRGGFGALRKALAMKPADVTAEVKKSNLRGRGGAGVPTGMKWSFVPAGSHTVYLVVNADEGEPGTFKDRQILRQDPCLLVEGCVIAAWALGCHHIYIYIRGEMYEEARILQAAVDECYQKGYLGPSVLGVGFRCDLTVHRGAGAYICGEETALLNSLEGKRGWPRLKPPFPAVKGLFGQPTVVNNVETLANVPDIVEKGGEWFAKLGTGRSGGTRVLCVSGHVNKPGVYELRMGIPMREVIDDVCGGVRGGRRARCVIPGGSSMPPLDETELDVPVEFDALMTDARIKDVEVTPGVKFDVGGGKPLKTMAGSGAVVVLDDRADLVEACARLMRFYAHESCGQCTPCREGTGWLARVCSRLAVGQGRKGDSALLATIAHGIAGNTICPLGDAAAWPMLGFITKFRDDFLAKEPRS